jgi:hypothetical protein
MTMSKSNDISNIATLDSVVLPVNRFTAAARERCASVAAPATDGPRWLDGEDHEQEQ